MREAFPFCDGDAMSFRLVASAWEADIKSPGCKLVLMGLASYCNEEGYCFPRQETLAERTGQGVRTVRYHLAWLEANGYIERSHRSATSGRRSDEYFVSINASQPAKIAGCATGEKQQTQPAKIAACTIHESVIKNIPDASESETIYQAYPRKAGKLAALKAIEKAIKRSGYDAVLSGVQAFAAKVKKERTEERFIAHPATWFNQGRWMDADLQPKAPSEDWGTWGPPSTWPPTWRKHPTENRPMRPGEGT